MNEGIRFLLSAIVIIMTWIIPPLILSLLVYLSIKKKYNPEKVKKIYILTLVLSLIIWPALLVLYLYMK